jgi:anti-sigma B factor antagonist
MSALADLIVSVAPRMDHCVLTLDGELDLSNATALTRLLERTVAAGEVRIVVDASGLRFCDSAGLRLLMVGANRCTAAGGWLRLATPQAHLARALAVTGLLPALPTYRSLAGAAAGTSSDRIAD